MPIPEKDFTQEPVEEIKEPLKQEGQVSEKDIFKLAKNILTACLVVYGVVLILFAWSNCLNINGPMKEIWDFSSQGLFGIVNLIIGFYFGGKIASNKN